MKQIYYKTILTLSLLILLSACNKFLEEKSDKRLSTPTTLKDFQALVNQYGSLNVNFIAAGEVSADDYYLTTADYNALLYETDKRLYTWQPDNVTRPWASAGDEWYYTYQAIYICNAVLQGLKENNLTGPQADNIKGQALVFRAIRYLDGVQVWAPAYSKQTAATDMGMVLRSDPDMNISSVRSTVQETYKQIIKDLTDAIDLLPSTQPGLTLPTKAVAHGFLARTYLFMGEYEKALANAKAALDYNSALIDFNTLDSTANYPIPSVNSSSTEVTFWSGMFFAQPLNISIAKISPDLYNLYSENDLRKSIYFKKEIDGSFTFKGTHTGGQGLITGITTSELYLTLAECYARTDQLTSAADILNRLLVKRWKSNEFLPYTFNDKTVALDIILQERRKELVRRGLRWPDIKRLNRDGANITLKRTIAGETYTLPPNDLRYAIAIPEDIISISGIQQNPR